MFKYQFVLFLGAVLVYSAEIEVFPCKDVDAEIPLRYYVEGCDAAPCTIFNSTDQNIELTFLVPYDTSSMKVEVSAVLGGLVIEQPVPDHMKDACDFLDDGYQCPITEGSIVSGSTAFFVVSPIANIQVDLRFLVRGGQNQPILCFQGPVFIAS